MRLKVEPTPSGMGGPGVANTSFLRGYGKVAIYWEFNYLEKGRDW